MHTVQAPQKALVCKRVLVPFTLHTGGFAAPQASQHHQALPVRELETIGFFNFKDAGLNQLVLLPPEQEEEPCLGKQPLLPAAPCSAAYPHILVGSSSGAVYTLRPCPFPPAAAMMRELEQHVSVIWGGEGEKVCKGGVHVHNCARACVLGGGLCWCTVLRNGSMAQGGSSSLH